MKLTSYKSGQMIANHIEKHFVEALSNATKNGETNLATQPAAEVIDQILDVAFWASLRKEEGHSPKISLAYVSPDQVSHPLIFSRRLPFSADSLTKLAPGVSRSGIHIGLWRDEDGKLSVWGTTLSIPNFCLVVDVSEPGVLVIKHRRMAGLGKFTNVAVLKGDQIKIVTPSAAKLPDCPPLLMALLDVVTDAKWSDSANILIQLAVSMRAHGRGGALLIVNEQSENWRNSMVSPIGYEVIPPYNGLANLIAKDRSDASEIFWQSALKRETDFISGVTAVDGATVITHEFGLLAFGAKITRSKGSGLVGKVLFFEPVQGGDAKEVYPGAIGGTRHLSAAQFVHDQHDAIALVASQDGHFTIFSYSENLGRVLAQKLDTLLL